MASKRRRAPVQRQQHFCVSSRPHHTLMVTICGQKIDRERSGCEACGPVTTNNITHRGTRSARCRSLARSFQLIRRQQSRPYLRTLVHDFSQSVADLVAQSVPYILVALLRGLALFLLWLTLLHYTNVVRQHPIREHA
jgi:hypothetical protein